MMDEVLENEAIEVRLIQKNDLNDIIRIDAKNSGFRREQFLENRLNQSLEGTGIIISYAAVLEGMLVGFIMGNLYYGEFGQTEKSAAIDTLSVHPDFARRGIAQALLRQFAMNVKALHVTQIETMVDWESNFDLMGFFRKSGFKPGNRLHLSLDLGS